MKKIMLLIFLVFSFSSIFGQESRINTEMENYTKELKINVSQRSQLSKIIIRKYKDLESISSLRDTDNDTYRVKRRAAFIGAENSIKMLLEEDQLEHWKKYQVKKRKENAKRISDLLAENASKDDLLDAQFGIEN